MRRISTIILVVMALLLSANLLAETKAYLGVYLRDIAESEFEKLEVKDNYGVMVKKSHRRESSSKGWN